MSFRTCLGQRNKNNSSGKSQLPAMSCREKNGWYMEEEMKISTHLKFFVFSLSLLGCHVDHGGHSKDKYKKLAQKSNAKVPLKQIDDKSNFIHWQHSPKEKFYVRKVWNESKELSCKGCHQGYSLKGIKSKYHRRAHWHIKLKHASSKIMNCQTCHNQNQVWLFNFGEKKNQCQSRS